MTEHQPVTKQITVIVTGGRDYGGRDVVFRELDKLAGPVSDEHLLGDTAVTVHHGGATGADSWADEWAVVNWAGMRIFEADWNRWGRAAGPIRNEEMAKAGADLCLAFPGGVGTTDMVMRARAHGIEVREVS